ncbi:amidohydrolase, partial [Sutterella sp.]|uniref:amidohydrolase n=1 Tax=Sutterella sp. TaxID=1981025 RepID=UPI0026E023A6
MTQIYDPVALRRELHEMPELGLKEVKTSKYVAEKLEALGIETQREVGGTTGVLGIIRGAEPGPVFLIRADMDALPFIIDGKPCCIHACGHDAHTAMLLAAASRLKDKVRRGTLKLLFQPAEETLKGAPAMLKAGVFDDVEYALGAHIRPIQDVPAGKLCAAVRHTSSSTLWVEIQGRQAHASRPHLGVNAIDVSVAVIEGIQAIWLDPKMSWSAKATQIHSDAGASNTVPDKARITFDVRAQTNDLMDELLERIKQVVAGVSAAYGAEGKVILNDICPACWYDDDFTAEVADAIRETAGADNLA